MISNIGSGGLLTDCAYGWDKCTRRNECDETDEQELSVGSSFSYSQRSVGLPDAAVLASIACRNNRPGWATATDW